MNAPADRSVSAVPAAASNRRLLVIASGLLVVNIALQLVGLSSTGAAYAGPDGPPVFPNNAEVQRRQAEALTEISAKLGRIESKLDKTMNVKVVEMPAIVIPSGGGGNQADASGKR